LKEPSNRQLERHIRHAARGSANVVYTKHARQRMRKRQINDSMVLDTLRHGSFDMPPEVDIKHPGMKCRMQWFVAGVNLCVVVYVEYPATNLVVVTAFN
jgi:hypothetical protein